MVDKWQRRGRNWLRLAKGVEGYQMRGRERVDKWWRADREVVEKRQRSGREVVEKWGEAVVQWWRHVVDVW